MLQLFRNKSPYTVLILLILTLLLKSQMLVQPQAPKEIEGYFLYNGVIKAFDYVLHRNAFFYTFLSVLMVFVQGLYLNFITQRHRLFIKPTYFPALVYILFTSVHPTFNYFSVPLLVSWCMLIGVDIFLGFSHSTSPRKNIFNSALAISVAGLFHFSAVAYLLVFIAALLLLRPFNAGEAVVGLIGYITPLYFAAAILFIVDMLPALMRWPDIDFAIIRKIHTPVYIGILSTGIAILSAGSVYAMQQQLPKATISIRRSWVAVLAYLLVSIAVSMFGSIKVHNAWLLTIPPLSLVIAQGLMIEKSKWFSNFILYFSIAIVIACRLALNK